MSAKRKTSLFAESGFTLIEVMMAMLVLTVGLLGLLQSVSIAYEHNLRNRLREEAVGLAEEQLHAMLRHGTLKPVTTASRLIGGVNKQFVVARRSEAAGGETDKLTVAVSWGFKNISTTHEIYTLKKGD
jgi:type IV pilus assembly protein PilV